MAEVKHLRMSISPKLPRDFDNPVNFIRSHCGEQCEWRSLEAQPEYTGGLDMATCPECLKQKLRELDRHIQTLERGRGQVVQRMRDPGLDVGHRNEDFIDMVIELATEYIFQVNGLCHDCGANDHDTHTPLCEHYELGHYIEARKGKKQ